MRDCERYWGTEIERVSVSFSLLFSSINSLLASYLPRAESPSSKTALTVIFIVDVVEVLLFGERYCPGHRKYKLLIYVARYSYP